MIRNMRGLSITLSILNHLKYIIMMNSRKPTRKSVSRNSNKNRKLIKCKFRKLKRK